MVDIQSPYSQETGVMSEFELVSMCKTITRQLTLIPSLAHSTARLAASCRTAAFEAL